MAFGGLHTLYQGLEGVIGPPSTDLAAGMHREHCRSRDSQEAFEAPNYGTVTTSEIEYYFVCHPEEPEAIPLFRIVSEANTNA